MPGFFIGDCSGQTSWRWAGFQYLLSLALIFHLPGLDQNNRRRLYMRDEYNAAYRPHQFSPGVDRYSQQSRHSDFVFLPMKRGIMKFEQARTAAISSLPWHQLTPVGLKIVLIQRQIPAVPYLLSCGFLFLLRLADSLVHMHSSSLFHHSLTYKTLI